MEDKSLQKKKQQERVHGFLAEWKKSKAADEKEAKEAFDTPEYQVMLEQLRKQNEAKGIIIPG